MIYIRNRNLLFLKPQKTAGTSVEIALSCNANDADIVTPILPEDEKKRWDIGGRFPVNWAWLRFLETSYRHSFERYLETGVVPDRYFGLKPGRLYSRMGAKFINHIAPDEVFKRKGSQFLKDAFLVTMVRHPYEAVISMSHHQASLSNCPLEQMIRKTVDRKPLNEEYLFASKKPDFVIRYENLTNDLADLERRFDLVLVDKLPFTKHKARTDRRPAREALSGDQRARIHKKYIRTFETYGYEA